jgi:conserved oligomeric Golgi complex subunit 3
MHLLYTRFTTVAGQLAPLLGEFERRARTHPEELGALLSECHAAYFGARKSLLVARLTEQIRGLDPTRTELVELVRLFFSRCVHGLLYSLSAFSTDTFRV